MFVYFGHKREITIPPPWWTNAAHRNNGLYRPGNTSFEGVGKFNDLAHVFGRVKQISSWRNWLRP